MKKSELWHKLLHGLYNYLLFFLLTAFLVTCTTSLFVTVLAGTLEIELTDENVQTAAKLTFANVLLLSILFMIIDVLRRKFTTVRMTEHIKNAAERLVDGDFDVRIEPISSLSADESYNAIIESFNKMAEELSGVETLRTDFIANVSHEMKTPLAVIQNYGTLLEDESLDSATRAEYARIIVDSARRLASMMENVLKISRLENQQIYPSAETFELGEQLCECFLQFESVWERRGIEIDTDIEEGVYVCCDRELLSLVWNNLLSNALKFTERGGRVTLSLRGEGELATVSVADTGCGISADVGAHIFEKFYQADTSHKTEGNGLGLALVKRVVDILDGEISVESAPGCGSTFTVRMKRICDNAKKDT